MFQTCQKDKRGLIPEFMLCPSNVNNTLTTVT
jgi:hypothetical protein